MNKKIPYYFLLPALLFMFFFLFIPVVQVFSYSFFDYNIFQESKFIGLRNFIKLFNDPKFFMCLINSLLFLLITPVLILISLTMALFLRENNFINKLFRSVYFIPVITPVVIAGICWTNIFSEDLGLVNYLLNLMHISSLPWLTKYPLNLIPVSLITIWRGFGYYMLIIIAGLSSFPKEVEEAAELDGASKIQQVVHIILPMLKPVILFVTVMSSSAAIKLFTELYIVIPGTPLSNKSIVYYMYKHAFERFDFGYGSAAGIIIFLLTLSFSLINIKTLDRE